VNEWPVDMTSSVSLDITQYDSVGSVGSRVGPCAPSALHPTPLFSMPGTQRVTGTSRQYSDCGGVYLTECSSKCLGVNTLSRHFAERNSFYQLN